MNTYPTSMYHYTINKMSGDMNFVGMYYIIVGILSCLSIVGAIIGIPYIISGLRIRESANNFRGFLATNEQMALEQAIEKQSKFFFIQKVIMIVSLVIMVISIIALIAMIGFIATYFHNPNVYNV